MEINYDELRRIHRLERNTSKLVEVEEDFIESLNNFLEEEKENYLKSMKDFSSKEIREFSNLKRVVEEILLLRKKKILNKALIASQTKEVEVNQMAKEEKSFFKKILEVIENYNACYTCLGEKESKGENVTLKMLKEVPSFVGADMKEYGPFDEGEEIELPKKVAKLFLSRKIAEEVK